LTFYTEGGILKKGTHFLTIKLIKMNTEKAQVLVGYKAIKEFKSEDGSLNLDRDDKITIEEYELLSFAEQEYFNPSYENKILEETN
jgi:hypothetical protein